MSALGILALSVPALSLNSRKKAVNRIVLLIRGREERGDKSVLDSIAKELKTQREEDAGRWRRSDEICLFLGYILLFIPAWWRVFG
ncbi:hypothetical protein H2509_18195 [Stappia sp. F7233]|uniref:Uncharacterized protein n=2 Tax=Stappia albiluteola TaxID=2758565 RepID=A0A839AJD6_9HYPH|nr:hypothetical protein [Stappia albiluteola]